MPTKLKSHLIEEYKVQANTILCICGWFGDADAEWKQHKLELRETKPWMERKDRKKALAKLAPITLREGETKKESYARVRVQNKELKTEVPRKVIKF